MQVVPLESRHLADVGRLFDLYRQFYERRPDLDLATAYMTERFENGESTVFVAELDDRLVGFTQLYESFCSVQAVKIVILYDLYVDADVRNGGVGRALMTTARGHAEAIGAKRMDLLTGVTNHPGQHLYESLSWKRVDEDHFAYSLDLG